MGDAKNLVKKIKDEDIKFVDLRFTDPRGKMQHVTMDVREMDEDAFNDGIMFDGSSIAGWKVINESDMKLMPDTSTAVLDPFFAQSTLAIFCDVLEPLTNEPYERDPRGIANKAMAYLKQTGAGDTAVFGPEAEFFVFDDVRFAAEPFNCGYKIELDRVALEHGHRIRDGQSRSPAAHQGRLFPGATDQLGARSAVGDALGHGRYGRRHREASPRSRRRAARARHQVWSVGQTGRTRCRSTNT